MKTPKYHKAVASFAGKSDHRPELLNVSYKDGTATATDAFRAIIARAPVFENIDGLIDAPYVTKHMDELGKRDNKLSGSAHMDASKYPNVQKVLDGATAKEPIARVSVNVEYMADICKALSLFASGIKDVTIEFRGAGEPLVLKVKRSDDVSATALLMPLRS